MTEDQVLTHWTPRSVEAGYRSLRLESRSCEIDYIAVGITFRKFVIPLKQTLPAELHGPVDWGRTGCCSEKTHQHGSETIVSFPSSVQ